jgi:hypothetical protein
MGIKVQRQVFQVDKQGKDTAFQLPTWRTAFAIVYYEIMPYG